MKKGDIVQFQAYWGQPPSMTNTGLVLRVARDGSWADVQTMFGSKRVPNPGEHLRIVDEENESIIIEV